MSIENAEETPAPTKYLAVVPGIRVGCGILELADRITVVREPGQGPRVDKRRVLSVTIDGDIQSRAEAHALAAALHAYGNELECPPSVSGSP